MLFRPTPYIIHKKHYLFSNWTSFYLNTRKLTNKRKFLSRFRQQTLISFLRPQWQISWCRPFFVQNEFLGSLSIKRVVNHIVDDEIVRFNVVFWQLRAPLCLMFRPVVTTRSLIRFVHCQPTMATVCMSVCSLCRVRMCVKVVAL